MGNSVEWKGAMWDVLYRKQGPWIQVYVGYQSSSVDKKFRVNARYRFSVKSGATGSTSQDRGIVCSISNLNFFECFLFFSFLFFCFPFSISQADRYIFGSEKIEGRVDRGFNQWISIHELKKDAVFLEMNVALEEIFEPTRAPLNYNSKRATDMVGLENLGATCYLNALLQVHLQEKFQGATIYFNC